MRILLLAAAALTTIFISVPATFDTAEAYLGPDALRHVVPMDVLGARLHVDRADVLGARVPFAAIDHQKYLVKLPLDQKVPVLLDRMVPVPLDQFWLRAVAAEPINTPPRIPLPLARFAPGLFLYRSGLSNRHVGRLVTSRPFMPRQPHKAGEWRMRLAVAAAEARDQAVQRRAIKRGKISPWLASRSRDAIRCVNRNYA